jgi:CRP-like cAMP-binding protein
MDLNLILSAQTLGLAPQLQRSGRINGLIVLKNVLAKTYLRVTPEQWAILKQFEKPRTVPSVLDGAILDRQCIPLGEFFELILKALRAHILLEPGAGPGVVRAHDWRWSIRPQLLSKLLIFLTCAGLVATLVFRPILPASFGDGLAGLLLLSATLSLGSFLSGCLVRGAGVEVYRPRWQWLAVPPHFEMDITDAVMLPIKAQRIIGLVQPALLFTVAELVAWRRPGWEILPLLGAIVSLRPFMGGHFASLLHVGREHSPSDAEQAYIFPPNRRAEERGRLLKRALHQPTTWVKMAYAVGWTLVILFWGARLADMAHWTFTAWKANGLRVALGVGGSLAALGAGYIGWEFYQLARERARARRDTLRRWRGRWFGAKKIILDESTRVSALAASPLFSMLTPPQRLLLARAMEVGRHGPWKSLPAHEKTPTHVSLIISGKVSLRRELPTGRTVQVQVLSEGDVIGLHDRADPNFPSYRLRSLTPVTLLTVDRATADEIALGRIHQAKLTDTILKLPFLRRISLCQNWHLQAVERFARLSAITDYTEGRTIIGEGQSVQDFFIIFEGNAVVTRRTRRVAVIHAGGFFGEIGLMQNSTPNATIMALHVTRCLSISRAEFMRFVTHNHTVALELERVSSERLGHPLFPLKKGDFRTT